STPPSGEALAPFAGSDAGLALEEPAEVVLALEAAAERDLLDGEVGLAQERARTAELDLYAVLVRAETGVMGKRPAEPGVAHAQPAGELGQGRRRLGGIVRHAVHRLVDRACDVPAALLAGLQGRVEQGHYGQGSSRRHLLDGRAPGAHRVDDGAEGREEQVLLPHPQHRPPRGEEAVAYQAPDHRAVAPDPVLAPAD